MDPFTTPVRAPVDFSRGSLRPLPKSAVLDIIKSIDFTDIQLPSKYFTSGDESHFERFVDSFLHALRETFLARSPPKSSPKKFLESVQLTPPRPRSPSGSPSPYYPLQTQLSSFVPSSPSGLKSSKPQVEVDEPTIGDDALEIAGIDHVLTAAPGDTQMSEFHDTLLGDENLTHDGEDQDAIIGRFLAVQPNLTRDSIILPEDSYEREKRLKMMSQITPHLTPVSTTPFPS